MCVDEFIILQGTVSTDTSISRTMVDVHRHIKYFKGHSYNCAHACRDETMQTGKLHVFTLNDESEKVVLKLQYLTC